MQLEAGLEVVPPKRKKCTEPNSVARSKEDQGDVFAMAVGCMVAATTSCSLTVQSRIAKDKIAGRYL